MLWVLLLLAGGLVLLWKGADLLSEGAVGLAERMGVSQLIIGLTIVAMGTSAPELAAGIIAARDGRGDIVVGNVFGANIADLAMIAGLGAMVGHLRIQATTLKREIPAMLVVALLLLPVLRNMAISRLEGVFLVAVFATLMILTIRTARGSAARELAREWQVVAEPPRTVGKDILFMVLGFVALAIGANMAVHSAEAIGTRAGLSDAVIGATILAIGTTLPELMTSIVAAVKGRQDISVGNLVGSVIFNSLLVVGVAALARPLLISQRLAGGTDYWFMMGTCAAFTVVALLGRGTIRRLSGALLLTLYGLYLLYLLRSTGAI